MDETIKNDILRNIELLGAADSSSASSNVVIGSRSGISTIIDMSSGLARIRSSKVKEFKLILSIPKELQALSTFNIRCSLCNRVISYPSWYYKAIYATNSIHYFICFNGEVNDKVTARCYRRD